MIVSTLLMTIQQDSDGGLSNAATGEKLTLEDLGRLIAQGAGCRVTSATGEDVTAETLARIVSEMHRVAYARLPVSMLEWTIRSLGHEVVAQGFETWRKRWEEGAAGASGVPWPHYDAFFAQSSQWLEQWSDWLKQSAPPSG